jgi:hypothetical protein
MAKRKTYAIRHALSDDIADRDDSGDTDVGDGDNVGDGDDGDDVGVIVIAIVGTETDWGGLT